MSNINASENTHDSAPFYADSSRGSSVSSRLQDEYDELLKYAVVVPSYEPGKLPHTLSDFRGSFPQQTPGQTVFEHKVETEEKVLPDFDENGSTANTEDTLSEVNQDVTPGQVQKKGLSASTPLNGTPRETVPKPTLSSEYMKTVDDPHLAEVLFTGRMSPTISESSKMDDDSVLNMNVNVNKFCTMDQDMGRMEGLMDQWTYDLKRNVLAEFSRNKIKMMELYRQQLQKERERHNAELSRQTNEMDGLRELLHTYEQSIERKDQVISNLTKAMQQQRDRFEMLKTFCEWKIRHNDVKREAFATNLARKHYQRALQQKVWDSWHSVIETKWKTRVESACQSKAQEVCMQLTNDYEARITSLNEALEASRAEVNRLHAERDRYEETMKKAFMRGVCALNLEAMTMFHESDEQGEVPGEPHGKPSLTGDPEMDKILDQAEFSGQEGFSLLPPGFEKSSYAQEAIFNNVPPGAPAPRVVTCQTGTRTSTTGGISQPKMMSRLKPTGRGKSISAKVTARTDTGRGGLGPQTLAPPMSSVMVERHQPITKETVGHATASKFPHGAPGTQSTILHRKIAGQVGQLPLANPNIRTVKVVD